MGDATMFEILDQPVRYEISHRTSTARFAISPAEKREYAIRHEHKAAPGH